MMNRRKILFLRVNEIELAKIEKDFELSGYKNRSRFLRESLLQKRSYIGDKKNILEIDKLTSIIKYELKKVAINYNQITKVINSQPKEKQLLALMGRIETLTRDMIELYQKVLTEIKNNESI